MKKNLLFVIFLFLFNQIIFSQNYLWAKNIGGPGYDIINSIRLDASGNVYATGYFSDTTDFDPGIGTATLVSAGLEDVFVAKYDNAGNYIWAVSFGGTGDDYGYGIQLDAAGNVFVCGSFENTVDFDPGLGTNNITSNGGSDIYIAKFNNNGNYSWTKTMGGLSNELAQALQLNAAGDIFFTGYYSDIVDFDASPVSVFNLSSAGAFLDVFLCKYDNAGAFLFAKSMGGVGNDIANCLQLDGAGNIYLSGSFQSTADLDPDAGTTNLVSDGGTDIFLSKYNNTGALVWAKKFGGNSDDNCNSFQLDATGNIYMTGYFSSVADFDPGAGVANLTSNGNYDIFISRIDNNGNYTWAKSIGGTGNDLGRALQVDGVGNAYFTGTFEANADFDPGPGTSTMSPAGQVDIFISKFDNAGNATRVNRIGGFSSSLYSHALQIDPTDNLYIGGKFTGYIDFDPGIFNTAYLSSIGNNNMFMVKYDNVPVGLDDVRGEILDIRASPNPNNGQFYLSGNSELKKLKVEVIDVTGKIILHGNFNSEKIFIDISQYSKGLYFVRILNEAGLLSAQKICVE